MIIVNGWKLMASAYHKAVHLGCCSPRSASVVVLFTTNFKFFCSHTRQKAINSDSNKSNFHIYSPGHNILELGNILV